jgi:hypothetical protein
MIEYYVMQNDQGITMWLSDDEKTWTPHFHSGAAFTDAKLANDIAVRQLGSDRTFYVMGCVASDPGDGECE